MAGAWVQWDHITRVDPDEALHELFQHNWVCGTTGAGKTTELLNWMVQFAYAGHGFVYFGPKARDSKELLQLLPEDRLDDVIWSESVTSRKRC